MPSPISPTTVVHHDEADGEHWTVLAGTTVVAYCRHPEEAAALASRMNESKRVGDAHDPSASAATPSSGPPASAPTGRCHGLDITPKPPNYAEQHPAQPTR